MGTADNSRKRNILLICLCFFAYTCSYFLKLSYNANLTELEDFYHVAHSKTGLISTLFFVAYGAGQFINGAFAKKYPLRIVIPVVLFLSSIINLLIFVNPEDKFYLLKWYWLANGILLSFLWPCVIRMLSENVGSMFKDNAVVIIGATTATGTFLVYGLSALFSYLKIFKIIFLMAVVLGVAFSVIWYFVYPKVVVKTKEEIIAVQEELEEKKNASKTKLGFGGLLIVLIIAVFCCIATLGRDGLQLWFPVILKEDYGYENSIGILMTTTLPLFQMIGTFLSVKICKKIKNDVLVSTLFFAVAGLLLLLNSQINLSTAVLTIILLVITVLSFTAVINIGTAIMPINKFKENSGFYAGIFNGCGYVGSAISAYVLGLIGEKKGWDYVMYILIILALAAALIGFLFFAISKIIEKKKQTNLD